MSTLANTSRAITGETSDDGLEATEPYMAMDAMSQLELILGDRRGEIDGVTLSIVRACLQQGSEQLKEHPERLFAYLQHTCEKAAKQHTKLKEAEHECKKLREELMVQKRAREEWRHLALHDALTDLPNRTLFYDRLEQAQKMAQRDPSMGFALLFLDVDGFKEINDRLGHTAGDQILQLLARRLNQSVRGVDTVARIGGDEFTVLLHGLTKREDIEPIVDRMMKEISQPIQLGQAELRLQMSIGIALSNELSCLEAPVASLLNRADQAMYQAKRAGKNCATFFQPNAE